VSTVHCRRHCAVAVVCCAWLTPTRSHCSMELMLGSMYYDGTIDAWSAGCGTFSRRLAPLGAVGANRCGGVGPSLRVPAAVVAEIFLGNALFGSPQSEGEQLATLFDVFGMPRCASCRLRSRPRYCTVATVAGGVRSLWRQSRCHVRHATAHIHNRDAAGCSGLTKRRGIEAAARPGRLR
jgi:hypothetical protein